MMHGVRPFSDQRDHPRVRGEHRPFENLGHSGEGPPPRAQGAPRAMVSQRPLRGTTPACAGSTTAMRGPGCRAKDHPRVRGEHPCRPAALSRVSPENKHFRWVGHFGCGVDGLGGHSVSVHVGEPSGKSFFRGAPGAGGRVGRFCGIGDGPGMICSIYLLRGCLVAKQAQWCLSSAPRDPLIQEKFRFPGKRRGLCP